MATPTGVRLRIGIVDDDAGARARLVGHVRRFASEQMIPVAIEEHSDAGRFVAGYRPTLDLLLLDVRMFGIDGMQVATRIREVDAAVEIVFVTNLVHRAVEGYQVRALDYLAKPASYERLRLNLSRVVAQRLRACVPHLVLDADCGRVRVSADELLYLESARRRTVARTFRRELPVNVTLKAFEDRLSDHGFFRINVGLVVNLRHVVALRDRRCVLVEGTELAVSRSRKKELLVAMSELIGRRSVRGPVSTGCAGKATGHPAPR